MPPPPQDILEKMLPKGLKKTEGPRSKAVLVAWGKHLFQEVEGKAAFNIINC